MSQEAGSSKSSLLVAVHNLARLPSPQNELVASVWIGGGKKSMRLS